MCASFTDYCRGFSALCVIPTSLVSLFAETALIANDRWGPLSIASGKIVFPSEVMLVLCWCSSQWR